MKANIRSFRERNISVIYFLPIVNFYVGQILSLFELKNLSIILLPITYLISIQSYYLVVKSKFLKNVFIIQLITLIFMISLTLFPEGIEFLFKDGFLNSNIFYFYIINVPLFLLAIDNINFNKLLKYFLFWSQIVIVLLLINFMLQFTVYKPQVRDYMTFSYSSTIPIFILYFWGKARNKNIYKFLSILGSIVIVIGGSRGAIVMIMMFFVLASFYLDVNNSKRKILLRLLISPLLFILVLNFNNIANSMVKYLQTLGFKSRNLIIFLENGFLKSEGRSNIIQMLYPNFNLFGNGLYSDILLTGFYAHNWIIEIIFQFGIFSGLIIVFFIIFTIIKSFYYSKLSDNTNMKLFSLITLTIFFWKLLISGSYLTSSEFWLFLGLSIYIKKNWRTHIYEN